MIKLPLDPGTVTYTVHDVGKIPPVSQRLVKSKDAEGVGLLVFQLDSQEQVDACLAALRDL